MTFIGTTSLSIYLGTKLLYRLGDIFGHNKMDNILLGVIIVMAVIKTMA
jgi:hypothetical protein